MHAAYYIKVSTYCTCHFCLMHGRHADMYINMCFHGIDIWWHTILYICASFFLVYITYIYLDLLAAVLDICHLEKAQRLFNASKTHRAWLSPSWRVWQECQCLKYFSSGPYCHWHHWHWTVVMLYVWTLWSPVYALYHALYIRCMACQLETLFLQHSLPAHLCFSGGGAIISSSFLSSQRLHPQNSNFFNLSGCFQK